jgi:hypothetical protein
MGNSNSGAISITVDRSNLFYFTGEIVSGKTGFNIPQGKVRADKIYIHLLGEIGYTTTQTVTNGDGNTSTLTNYHEVPFYSIKVPYARSEIGRKKIVCGPGQYSWPFQILLPDHLSPTINQPHLFPHVRYTLQVVIDKPWYKQTKRETKYLTIYPHVNLLHHPQCLSSIVFGNKNRKDITLKGTLNKSGYIPGELINITLEIENPRGVLIKHIDLSMIHSYRVGENSHGYYIFKTTLPNIKNSNEEHIEEKHSTQIPSMLLPPTYKFKSGTQTTASVDNCYMLRFAVKVGGMFTNFDVDIPIILGTESNPDLIYQQIFNPMNISY